MLLCKYCCHNYPEIALSEWNIGSDAITGHIGVLPIDIQTHTSVFPSLCVRPAVHLIKKETIVFRGCAVFTSLFVQEVSKLPFLVLVIIMIVISREGRLLKNIEMKCAWSSQDLQRVFNVIFQQLNE